MAFEAIFEDFLQGFTQCIGLDLGQCQSFGKIFGQGFGQDFSQGFG